MNKRNGQKTAHMTLELQTKKKDKPVTDVESLSALDTDGLVKAIVETPKGSRNKYDYDPATGLFECTSALKGGTTFPFEFGFIPSTKAEDGDPLDIIILMDEPTFSGCLVHTKVIGVLQAEQDSEGKFIRNDRLLGVHSKSINYGEYDDWQQIPEAMIEQLETFFVTYNQCKGKEFRPLGWAKKAVALTLLLEALHAKRLQPFAEGKKKLKTKSKVKTKKKSRTKTKTKAKVKSKLKTKSKS